MSSGSIIIPRDVIGLLEGDLELLGLFVLLARSARYKPGVMADGTRLEPGQFPTGKRALAALTKRTESWCYRALKRLQKRTLIELTSNRCGTIVTICDWGSYSHLPTRSEPPSNRNRTSIEPEPNQNRTTVEPYRRQKAEDRRQEDASLGEAEAVESTTSGVTDANRFKAIWNVTEGVRPCRSLSAKRLAALRSRLASVVSTGEGDLPWIDALQKAATDKFPLRFTRGSPDGWLPDADWILRPDILQTIFEGKYDWTRNDGNENTRIGPGQRFDDTDGVIPEPSKVLEASGF